MNRTLCVFVVSISLLASTGAFAASPCVDIETATAKAIQAGLKGAGPKVAKSIVNYRKAQRAAATKTGRKTWNFKNWKTLLKVPGLGPKFCQDNVATVCFKGKVQKSCPK
jgi:DNA uptake protein ComE-like DNA-binding protein